MTKDFDIADALRNSLNTLGDINEEIHNFMDTEDIGLSDDAKKAMKMLLAGLYMAAECHDHSTLLEPRVAAAIVAACAVITTSYGIQDWTYESVEECFQNAQEAINKFLEPYRVKAVRHDMEKVLKTLHIEESPKKGEPSKSEEKEKEKNDFSIINAFINGLK